ncbi:MarR family winged helix-turn-helix transcriptional regulator [Pararhodospirillum oryzae]|uniref:MarR family transcriptional regulator n=1 Tax=Pararhodospirillum oryzae TaxID=478448 RepID=A0A512H482_9PROT|nr:MarR family transcriptional regulator [Pararhodospirillum oryzae]GEO80190.1 MarR family transcriptional regulator [Pararhodospirillum oryzae]
MDSVDRLLDQWHRERPDLDVGPMGVIGRLIRIREHLMEAMARVHKAHGLTPAGFDVLATLRRAGPPHALSPSALVESTLVTSGTMTHRLDRLEAAGWIERRPNPEDGRGSVVALTPAGFALIDHVIADHVAAQHRLLAALPAPTRARLDADLKAWLSGFETPQEISGD